VRILFVVFLLIASGAQNARADDFGPHGDVRELRFAAQRLLAHRARTDNVEPRAITVSNVVVMGDAALLSWAYGPPSRYGSQGIMALVRRQARWWDALDGLSWNHYKCWDTTVSYPLQPPTAASGLSPAALLSYGLPAALVNRALQVPELRRAMILPTPAPQAPDRSGKHLVRPDCEETIYVDSPGPTIRPGGGTLWQIASATSGYDITIAYSRNDAPVGTSAEPLYARPPTLAEIIPYPTTPHFISTAVLYFDLTLEGSAPVTFQPETTVDIWFPFVLDDTLSYDLTIGFADRPIGPFYSKPFDNVLHYTLPGFTATPGRTLMAEIDGNWP